MGNGCEKLFGDSPEIKTETNKERNPEGFGVSPDGKVDQGPDYGVRNREKNPH